MKRSIPLMLAALTALTCSVTLGQTSTTPASANLNIPVYSGGKIRAEISLSNEDILPMVKDAIKSAGQKSPGPVPPMLKHLESLDLNTLHEALAGISAVRGIMYELPNAESAEAVEEFYLSYAKSAGWNRIIFLKPTPDEKISVNVFAKGQEGMLGVIIGKQPKGLLVAAGGTQGMPNIQKLVEWGKAAIAKLSEAGVLPIPGSPKPKAVPKPPAK